MKVSANGGGIASSSMNAPVVGGPITLSLDVIKDKGQEAQSQERVLEKGRSPVRVNEMSPWLAIYPDRKKAELIREGFLVGFCIPFQSGAGGQDCRNLRSASEHPEVIRKKLATEVELGRMAGPFMVPPVPNLRLSPLGVVPKKEAGKFRLIHHLSHPHGSSVNDGIDEETAHVTYTSFDVAVRLVRTCGRGALMAKVDIESAFRLLPVHPDCQHLLGCKFEGKIYMDRCLPMGCSISCAHFEAFSSFLEWVVRLETGSRAVIHYLDDFLCVGKPGTEECRIILQVLLSVFRRFGVPVAMEKTEGPSRILKFLGIEIDSDKMQCRLPQEKIVDLKLVLNFALQQKKVTLRQLQSLLGKLNFACRIMPMGRVFCRRLAQATAGVEKPHHFVRLNKQHKADLVVWQRFLDKYNGCSFWLGDSQDNGELELFTDAAGAFGFGAFFQGQWCMGEWPREWQEGQLIKNLACLELFPIVLAVVVWGKELANKAVNFHSDNMSVVSAINNLSASSPPVVNLLRVLVLKCLDQNIWFRATHVPGVTNDIADAISRFQLERFRQLAPRAAEAPTPFPDFLWRIPFDTWQVQGDVWCG
ncbi:uncharacterized protein LOC121400643 [Xenopus laevis]|uniref:ribonuclease H n=1 Tax=Xenopus laevis TaxID=8355 RepID=A0A8J1MGA8_XENLA|nr:uncharacterized protein LOC121400643 [Xenopus laevis]